MTADYLRSRLAYDPASGELRWKARDLSEGRWVANWNAKYAGTVAGSPDRYGYIKVTLDGHPHRAHRLAWVIHYGSEAPKLIDHVDLNRANNRLDNLRAATQSQNLANQAGFSKTGFKGATRLKSGRFQAQVASKYLGSYATAEEAHAVAMAEANRRYGDFARAA